MLLFVLSAAFLIAWESQAEKASSICETDLVSRRICLSEPPRRVISLAPSLTETLFALKAGDLLVGRTARCNHPPEASNVPVVGEYMRPDLERIIDLKPDLVLAPQSEIRAEVISRLTALGIPVFIDDTRNLDDIRELISRLGHLLRRATDATKCIERFDRLRARVLKRIQNANTPTVLIAVGSAPLVAASGKSFLGSLILEAGGRNIVENTHIQFPKFSIEEVLRKDPDFILVLDKECEGQRCIEGWKRHWNLRAVKTGRLHVMDADLMARPSPRIVEGLYQLAKILHPNAFPLDQ